MFGERFSLLLQEGYLTKTSLLDGLHSLRKSNIDDDGKGRFYSSFFSLSIGFERMMKLILVIDFMSKNELKPMTDKQLRETYGHNIKSLYEGCRGLSLEYSLNENKYFTLGSSEWDILEFLHQFAMNSRYYNLSKLSDSNRTNDPLSDWWKIINKIIFSDLSRRKIEAITRKSIEDCDSLGVNGFTMNHGLDGSLLTMMDNFQQYKLIDAVSPYVIWKILELLKPLYDLICKVVDNVHSLEIESGYKTAQVPYLYEFFTFILIDRKQALRKKNWNA